MVSLDVAEELVRTMPNSYWDGWTLVIHRPNKFAANRIDGKFYNGKWGFEERYEPDSNGNWSVPTGVKTSRGTRRRS